MARNISQGIALALAAIAAGEPMTIDIDAMKRRCSDDPSLAVYMVRDTQEVVDADLTDLAWALTNNHCTENDALGFFDLLERYQQQHREGKPMTTTTEKLNILAEFQAQADAMELERKAAIDKVLTPEIRQAVADIDAEYAGLSAAVFLNITQLMDEIKAEVLALGESVKGDRLQAIWTKPRVSWNAKALDGYALAHPELLAFRTEGEPSVSLRSR